MIRNGKLQPGYQPTVQALPALAARSISTMVKYQSVANITALVEVARRANAQMTYVAIHDFFAERATSEFHPAYMSKLFAVGESLGRGQAGWRTDAPASPNLAAR